MLVLLYSIAAIATIIAKSHNYNINHDLNPDLRVKRSDYNGDVKFRDKSSTGKDLVANDVGDGVEDPPKQLHADNLTAKQENGRADPDKPNEEVYSEYSAVSFSDADKTNDGHHQQKRSLYLSIPFSTLLKKVDNKTENKPDTTSTQPPDIDTESDVYDDNDYDNGGRYIVRKPITVDTTTNKTEKYPSNETNENKTQAYYPISHTYIPGYNKPDDVFIFEKGPVYTNDSSENKTLIDDKSKNYQNNSADENNDSTANGTNTTRAKREDLNNFEPDLRRVGRSYYIAAPNRSRAGSAQSYYPLSHTYIPGLNTEEDVFQFEGGPVVPVPNKKTSTTRKPIKQSNDDNKPDTTTKRTTPKNQHHTARPQNSDNKKTTPKNRVTPKPNPRPTTNSGKKENKPNYDSDSSDYENHGEFITYTNRRKGRPTPKYRHTPINYRPQINKNARKGTTHKINDSDEEDFDNDEEDNRNRKAHTYLIIRSKRSYYKPTTDKKITGYNPLSHYIPGSNTQDDVYQFEEGPVVPVSKENTRAKPNNVPEATTKRTTSKNKQQTMESQNNSENIRTTTKPNPKTTIGSKNNQNKRDSSDYENHGEFITYKNRNRDRPAPKYRPEPSYNRPQLNKDTRQGTTDKNNDSDEEDDRNRKANKHLTVRQKRSYYMPIYGSGNGRKKITGYYPLSHTYIPGFNTQEDVWNYEGGQVYPYPNTAGENTEIPNHTRRGHKKHTNHQETESPKHESLFDKFTIDPIKRLFGRRRRSIDTTKDTQTNSRFKDIMYNVVDKIANFIDRRDEIVIVDANDSATKANRINYIPDANANYQNAYNGDANVNYPQNYNMPYNPNSRSQYQGAYKTNDIFTTDANINESNVPQSTSRGVGGGDETATRIDTACFLCGSWGCPAHHRRLGPRCVRIRS